MRLRSIKILVFSLLVAGLLGAAGGLLYAWLADRVAAHGIGTGVFVVGLVAFALAMLGATEPAEGWASGSGRRRSIGRRSFGARLSQDVGSVESVTSLDLFVWGLVVGGGLMGLSMVAFTLAV